ncbi:hypothetical protein HZU75_02730 [Chitinibacter fontanus]|uniref:Uncharacterized protein n=1 Tax=Chitinibacter fontanus TaxID=1737446 RepID=A0A7D5V7V8_9NEIS|nr:hypothetical protein [Chitinibacter fontanus]QLI80537.1 hypothetical protein HZU75_02730 [Chitinibacter fontanus]
MSFEFMWAPHVHAEEQTELDALSLADQTPQSSEQQRSYQFFIEGMTGLISQKDSTENIHPSRISIDVNIDQRLNQQWRAVVANRLDLNWQAGQDEQINTLKEAYLSWQAQPTLLFDVGRINQRNGMAYGYNPSDYFKADAVRSVVSIAPSSLRENRLGSAMLRGQYLWESGAISALYSPKLADADQQHSSAPFAPDWAASNFAARWQLSFSQRWFDGFSPQFIVYREAEKSPQVGLNFSWLATDALTLYTEYSGGRGPSLLQSALGIQGQERFYSRVASGASYTLPINLNLTLEYQYNQAALNQSAWQALAQQTPLYWAYRQHAFRQQDNPTQHNLFLLASWNNAIWRNLDLNLMLRRDLGDQSLQHWLEARYHFKTADVAVQWQSQSGAAGSQYGALPQQHSLQLLLKYFF